MFRKRLSNAHRLQEIASALIRNGFSFIIKDLDLMKVVTNFQRKKITGDEALYSKSIGERVRLTLEELGPTFIKLGQLASTRIDLFPQGIIQELTKLQDDVKPVSYDEVVPIVEEELGQPIESLFNEFSREPVASASIGQVHKAILKTGEEVAIKIQRPNIESVIGNDLEILEKLAVLMEERIEWAKNYRVCDVVSELSSALKMELDYTNEARNNERIANSIKDLDYIKIPTVNWDLTTKKVLTMEYINGIKLQQFVSDEDVQSRKLIAKQLTECMFEQIFVSGFFHADPHPGNIFILPDKKQISLIDFGMIGRLTPTMKFDLASLLIALLNQDIEEITSLVIKLGKITDATDRDLLMLDLENLIIKYSKTSLKQVQLGELLNEVFTICFHHQIKIPADLTMLGKTLVTLEGLLAKIDPDIVLIDMAKPFGEKLIHERLHPKSIWKYSKQKIRDVQSTFSQIESMISSFTKKGKIELELDIPIIKELIQKIDRTTNQLSFSIVLLSFSIMMSGLIIGAAIMKEETVLWRFPVIELGGIVATLMFLWLLFSIFRSGRF